MAQPTHHEHDEILQLASISLDETLSAEESQRVMAHIADCNYCAAAVSQMTRVDEELRQVAMLSVPPNFTQQVLVAAFGDGSVARSVSVGLLVLLMSTLFMGGLWLLTNQSRLAVLRDIFFAGTRNSDAEGWGPRVIEGLEQLLSTGWAFIAALRDLLIGPLLIPALLALLVSVVGLWLFRRTTRKGSANAS